MAATLLRLLVRAEGSAGPPRQMSFERNQRVLVRELETRSTVQVLAEAVSPYRHTLIVDGVPYRVLAVTRAN